MATERGDEPCRPARVAFVGAGPGDPGLLTLRAAEFLAEADAVILDEMARYDVIARDVRPDAGIVVAGGGDHGSELGQASRNRLVVRTAQTTISASGQGPGLVVRLMDGDPGTFHSLADEIRACRREGIDIEVVPGITAVSAVPAYAGIPLTAPQSRSVVIACASHPPQDWAAAATDGVTVVLVGPSAQIAAALSRIIDDGRDPATPVAVVERGTTFQQRTHTTTLADARSLLDGGTLESPLLAIAGSTVEQRGDLSWWETKPLYGWRVLVPRTQDQAGSMVARLARYGAVGDVVPTIGVEPPRNPQQMQRAIKGLVTGHYEWVGLTSVNAVRAVREKFADLGLDVRAFAGLKVAAVGGATAQALRDWGLEPDLVPSGEQSTIGLLAEWPPYDADLDPINGVLLPRADIATDTLVAGLQANGWAVDDVTAYRTVRAAPPPAPVRGAIKGGDFDAVVFTSSSTVRNLVGIAGKPHASTVVACIGKATCKTAQEHGLNVAVVPEQANAIALVDALADYGRALAAAAAEAGEPVRRPSERHTTRRRKARR
ncbi:MAG TPA: bifunctional uroporphyrinogen-III C-methyltransferase/uroporphyrinogen-III synthase [Dermatophilaceae bacterium]|nr:bifunctional uroporphyrinogen-III C-methyltransferase/uroporphyrinogen-III synthase [Dermatophilaceae bacterium]